MRFNGADRGLVSQAEQVGKLEAAVAARTDPTTVIVARTAALAYCALDEALDRMQAYAQTGAEVLAVGRRRASAASGRICIRRQQVSKRAPKCRRWLGFQLPKVHASADPHNP